jgi:uncharacterized protein (TIGR02117 family)
MKKIEPPCRIYIKYYLFIHYYTMKTALQKIFKFTGKIIIGFIAIIVVYICAEYCLSSMTIAAEKNTPKDIDIYICTNGVHTDIVVPTKNEIKDWNEQILFTNTKSADTTYKYLAMGWGDKGFYLETPQWRDLKISTAFKAAFGLSNTAIHATYYAAMIENERCKKISISNKQYSRLVQYISASFTTINNNNCVITTSANYGNTDAFYDARGNYSLASTCNTWANNALKSCGQNCCVWAAFDTRIFDKYKRK